jgi:prevent-host-death family protein
MEYEETVSAADANRKFSHILREVRAGYRYVVTSHGTPVARIVPITGREQGGSGARTALLERLKRQPVVNTSRWTREELYEDDR